MSKWDSVHPVAKVVLVILGGFGVLALIQDATGILGNFAMMVRQNFGGAIIIVGLIALLSSIGKTKQETKQEPKKDEKK